jgi:diguanylate cyclase (GGDEF)-like protein/PAS domain S-box-containing protein
MLLKDLHESVIEPVPVAPGLAMTLLPHTHLAIADLLDILPDAVVMINERDQVVYVNPAVSTLLGYEPAELVGQPMSILVPPAVRERHAAMVARFRRAGQPKMMGSRPVLHAAHKRGQLVAVSISLCNLVVERGERVSVAVLHDVSMLNTQLDRATLLAESDPLTGIGNRLRLSRHMQALLANRRPFAMLYFDLTRFKALNDRYGHEAGDEALRIVARRLQADVRELDLAARLGGDEFVLVFDGLSNPAALQARAIATLESIAGPLRLKDRAAGAPLTLAANMGGAIYPHHGQTEQGLLAAADRAMYSAKRAGVGYRLADLEGCEEQAHR